MSRVYPYQFQQIRNSIVVLAKSTADSKVENTVTETDFATKHTVVADNLVVGQVYRVIVNGVLSTA